MAFRIVIFPDGTASLIEKVNNEYCPQADSFVDFYTLRHADGTQSKVSYREIKGLILLVSEIAEKFGMPVNTVKCII